MCLIPGNQVYHSVGLKVKEKQESNPGRQSDDRMGENSRVKANLNWTDGFWVLSGMQKQITSYGCQMGGNCHWMIMVYPYFWGDWTVWTSMYELELNSYIVRTSELTDETEIASASTILFT